VPLRHILHQPNGRAVGSPLGHGIPTPVLFGAEVRAVEQLLEAEYFDTLIGGIIDKS